MSNMKRNYEFIVNTTSTCFLCYQEIKVDNHVTISKHNHKRLFSSLTNLCRHLKINLSKTISVPEKLLLILDKLDVQVSLCSRCKFVCESFSKCCQELERLKTKLSFYLETIHGRMEEAGKRSELVDIYQRKLEVHPQALLHSGIVEKLRKEVMQKCHSSMKLAQPRVKIHRISKKHLRVRPSKLPSSPLDNEDAGALSSEDEVIPIELPNPTLADLAQLYSAQKTVTQIGGGLGIAHPNLQALLNNPSSVNLDLPSSSSQPSTKIKQHLKKNRTFRCKTCQIDNFWTSKDLSRHFRQFHQKRILCQFCNNSFCNNTIKNRHIRRGNCTGRKSQPRHDLNQMDFKPSVGGGAAPYLCKICSSSFPSRQGLAIHFSKKHRKRESYHGFACDLCSQTFATQRLLQSHRMDVHHQNADQVPPAADGGEDTGDPTYIPTDFTPSFPSASSTIDIGDVKPIRHHVNIEAEGDPGTDDLHPTSGAPDVAHENSKSSFPLPDKLNINAHSCEICSNRFATVRAKLRHVILCRRRQRTSCGGISYLCKFCGGKFSTAIGLGTHVSKIHLVTFKPRRFKCDLCPKTFIKNHNLKLHRMSVHFGSRFICKYCNKSFTLENSLYAHQRMTCEEAARPRRTGTGGPGSSENFILASASPQQALLGPDRDNLASSSSAESGITNSNRFNDNGGTVTEAETVDLDRYGMVSIGEDGVVNIVSILAEIDNVDRDESEIMPGLNSPEFQVRQLVTDPLSPDPLSDI